MVRKTMIARAESIKKEEEIKDANSGGSGKFHPSDMMGLRGQVEGASAKAPDTLSLEETESYRTRYLDINDVFDNTDNRFTVEDTSYLEGSIERLGQLQPIVVVRMKDMTKAINGVPKPYYEIKAGSRRFKAIKEIHKRAIAEGNMEKIEKFNKVFAVVLPLGATPKEIEDVITETNTTARQVSISDMFRNFDYIFEKDEDGNYIKFPNVNKRNFNVIDTVVEIFQNMGYSYTKGSIRDYWSIYQKCIEPVKQALIANEFSKKDCMLIKKLSVLDQQQLMRELNKIEEERISLMDEEIDKRVEKQGSLFDERAFEEKYKKETKNEKSKKIKAYVAEKTIPAEETEQVAETSITSGKFRGNLLAAQKNLMKNFGIKDVFLLDESDRVVTLQVISKIRNDLKELEELVQNQRIN